MDSLVAKDDSDGGWNITDRFESSSLDAFRDDPLDVPYERVVLCGRLLVVTACAIAVIEAGSCSGGEAFHLSKGAKSSYFMLCVGMSIAPIIGDAGPEIGLTFPRRRALASQLLIYYC